MGNTTPSLAKAEISIILAASKYHETVGGSELIIKKIKKLMVCILGSLNFSNVWDFSHKISLVSYYLNERPLLKSNLKSLLQIH